jgi:Protein of unknown function (DUF2955)
MLLNWESAYLAAVFVAILLEIPGSLPLKNGIFLFCASFAAYVTVFVVTAVLLPYPDLFLAAVVGILAIVCAMSAAGKSKLLVIMSLFAGLIIPHLVLNSVDIAWTQVIWMPLNLGIALLVAWAAFYVLPVPDGLPRPNPTPLKPKDRKRQFWRMIIGVVPVTLFFLLDDGEHLLTLLYMGLFTNQLAMSNEGASVTPLQKALANCAGAIAGLVAYEMVVIAPSIATLFTATLLICALSGWWLISDRRDANLARSALTGAIILFGGSMAAYSDAVEITSIQRLLEIAAAVVVSTFLFTILNKILPEREIPENRTSQLAAIISTANPTSK